MEDNIFVKVSTLSLELKEVLINQFLEYGEQIVMAHSGGLYSGTKIAEHIRNETDFGIEMMGSVLKLTIDLVSRKKETLIS